MANKETKLLFNTFLVASIIASSTLECSCDKASEPPYVEPTQGYINYTFNWDKILPGCPLPKNLRYCFYPLHGGPMLQIESDSKGLRFALAPDTYQLLIFNCDTANIRFANMDAYSTAEARLLPTKAGRTVPSASPLYGIAIDSLCIKADQQVEQEFIPQPLVQRVSFNVKVDGMQYVKQCEGTLTNISSALSLSKQTIIPNNPANVSFQTECTKTGITGSVFILGVSTQKDPDQKPGEPPKPERNQVVFDFTLADGSTTSSTADLGTQLTENGNEQGHDIVVDIEATVEKGPTFSVTLNTWKVGPADNTTIE